LKEINQDERIKIIPAVSFLDMIMLENNAKMIFTDSGGVQKEAYFFEKPCLILRPETEWIELLKNNCAILTDSDENKIIAGYEFFLNKNDYTFSKIFGKGATAQYICDKIIETFK
jgi:UDP-GlcNAc3NAcA epimerase